MFWTMVSTTTTPAVVFVRTIGSGKMLNVIYPTSLLERLPPVLLKQVIMLSFLLLLLHLIWTCYWADMLVLVTDAFTTWEAAKLTAVIEPDKRHSCICTGQICRNSRICRDYIYLWFMIQPSVYLLMFKMLKIRLVVHEQVCNCTYALLKCYSSCDFCVWHLCI